MSALVRDQIMKDLICHTKELTFHSEAAGYHLLAIFLISLIVSNVENELEEGETGSKKPGLY